MQLQLKLLRVTQSAGAAAAEDATVWTTKTLQQWVWERESTFFFFRLQRYCLQHKFDLPL